MGVAVSQPSDRITVQVPGHRAAAIATSVLGHAVVILGIVLLGQFAVEEEEPEPVRLVFVEPAPPPKLGVPEGGAPAASAPAAPEPVPAPPQAAPLERVVEPARPEPKPERVVPKPEPQLAKPKPEPKTKTKREPRPVARAKPAPAPAKPASADAAAAAAPTGDGTVAAPRGVAEGHSAGVAGGLAGGQVGGLGSDLTPLRQAAVPPRVVHQVMPDYPESARLRGIEGQVVIEAVISRSGSVEHGVKVVQSIPALDRAAIEAFQRWRFSPARDKNGNPLRVILQAPVRFVLR